MTPIRPGGDGDLPHGSRIPDSSFRSGNESLYGRFDTQCQYVNKGVNQRPNMDLDEAQKY